jgi:hypothetical protein
MKYFQQCHSPSLSDQTCDDSIIVNLKFHAVTKSPPPKLRNTTKSCGNEISEVTMTGFLESSTKQVSAFEYLSDEDEADQLGLPLTDFMSKVRHYLKTAQPNQPDVILVINLNAEFIINFNRQDEAKEEEEDV